MPGVLGLGAAFGVFSLGAVTGATVTFGVVTFGGETFGAPPDGGVVTFGVVTFGVLTVGVVAFGTVTVGAVPTGVETDGVVTEGVDTVGVVAPGSVSAPALVPAATANAAPAKKVAAIRLPVAIHGVTYLVAEAPKPVRRVSAEGRKASGRVRVHDGGVLGSMPGAAPAVDGEGVAQPLVEERLERGLGRQRLRHPAHEHDAPCDQLLALVRPDVGRDAPDRLTHIGLDVFDVAFRIELGEDSCHALQRYVGIRTYRLCFLLYAVSTSPSVYLPKRINGLFRALHHG
jgi:hypothetical protein